MNRYRKKPVVVEAMQFTIDNWRAAEAFGEGKVKALGSWRHENDVICASVKTLEGLTTAEPGDWIIKGTAGEFYPCKPEIFADIYEPAE